jgi:hypothetical protein
MSGDTNQVTEPHDADAEMLFNDLLSFHPLQPNHVIHIYIFFPFNSHIQTREVENCGIEHAS